MADYSKWKVVDLKAELKRRGIPQTGLRVKQNFIDRILEDEAEKQQGEATGVTDETPGAVQDTGEEDKQEAGLDAQRAPDVSAQVQEPPREEKEIETPKEEPEKVAQEVEVPETRDQQRPAEDTEAVEKAPEHRAEQVPEAEPSKELSQEAPGQAQAVDATGEQASKAPEAEAEAEAPAEPVEQAPGDATTKSLTPIERAVPSVPNVSEAGTGLSTPIPLEEVLEDKRKRKRRSQSPVPTPEAIANKKARAEDGSPRPSLPEERGAERVAGDKDSREGRGPTSADRTGEKMPQQEATSNEEARQEPISEEPRARKGPPLKQDARFKGLFAPAERDQKRAASPPVDTAMEDAAAEPALHAATSALYVDGLMRPLQPAALQKHIVSLASGPGASPNPDAVVDFYLDPIKTHCFISFANVSAASRVRTALHGTVWPNERNRKTLFVDFIPENKVQEWIRTEDESRHRRGPGPRWEVKYDRTEDGVEAVLDQVDPNAGPRGRAPSHPDIHPAPPTGPRADAHKYDRRPSGPPPPAAEPRPQPGQGFKPLDELFESTTAKPKLYYLPVPRAVADRRLDRFDDILRKGTFPRPGGEETRRISFEDEDLFVDHGPEYPGRNRRRGGRGGGGGRGRGAIRGGGIPRGGDRWDPYS